MCVTALLSAEIEWNTEDEDWHIKRITEDLIREHLEKLKAFRDHRYFLNFDWGVWVCAYARKMIWEDIVIPYDSICAYCDTDSAFLTKAIDWTSYNESQNKLLENICKERGLNVEWTRPANIKGKRSFLGNLTIEEEWIQFRTLGAKRYVERWKSDGLLHLTVAGINKEAVSCLNDDIENFKDGLVFDKDEKDVNKLLHTYVENMPDITFPDGYVSHQRRGVNLRPNGYRLSLDPDYKDLIKKVARANHNEQFENHLKSVWYDDVEELVDYAWGNILK